MALDTYLEIQPANGTAITFDVTGAESRTGGYVVPVQSLRFNEDKRVAVAYSTGKSYDGGRAVSYHGPMVELSFRVVIYGTTRIQVISLANALIMAVLDDDGGLIKYRPGDVGSSGPYSYYRYLQSEPPKPLNAWDANQLSSGLFAMQMDVILQTMPYVETTSATPTVVVNDVTVYNQDDALPGYVTISASAVKGTIEALTRLRILNTTAGSSIGKFWYFLRSSGLDNFDPILEGGIADDDSIVWWSTVSDTSRRSNSYLRYDPPESANELWAYRQFAITDIADRIGRAAICAIVRSWADSVDDWEMKATIKVASVEMETEVVLVERVGVWHVVILGELELLPTPVSSTEGCLPTLNLYLTRMSGTEPIDLDFIFLLYVDEYPQQIIVPTGWPYGYGLLLENFEEELYHIVTYPTLAFNRTVEAVGPLLKLKPAVEQRLYFLWQRLDDLVEDDFDGYEAWRWYPIADFESDETWVDAQGTLSAETTLYVEGSQALRLAVDAAESQAIMTLALASPLDLSVEGRFDTDDFVYLTMYIDDASEIFSVILHFLNAPPSNQGYSVDWLFSEGEIQDGWNFLKAKKSDFQQASGGTWSNVNGLQITLFGSSQNHYIIPDDLRLVRADPDDADNGNDTGTTWDFMADCWHIEEQDSADHAIGCLSVTAGVEQVALLHEEPGTNIKLLAKVRAKRDNGDVGIVFRCEDGTSGSEDMAAFFIDTTNDQLELRKWTAGAAADIATAVSQTTAPDTDYHLGVQLIGSEVRAYFATTLAGLWDASKEEFVSSAQKFAVSDSAFESGGALAGGQAGILSVGTLGRFDDVALYTIGEHNPSDSVEIHLPIIHRSVYPFGE